MGPQEEPTGGRSASVNNPGRGGGETAAGAAGEAPGSSQGRWRRLLRLPVLLGTVAATALIGFLINQFGPDVVEKVGDKEPVRVRADYDEARYGDGWEMATPTPIALDSGPPRGSTNEQVRRWATKEGGALVDEAWLQLLIEGRRSGGVVVKGMRARSVARGEPHAGTSIRFTSAGLQGNSAVGFDLDSPSPTARSVDDQGKLGRPYFSDNSITLAKGENMTLNVVGKAERNFHRWVIDMDIVVGGEEKTLTVGGAGYETTPAAKYETAWDWAWEKGPAARLVPGELSPERQVREQPRDDGQGQSACDPSNGEISPSDRAALSDAAGASEPAVAGSVYFGTCSEVSWAVAQFPGRPSDGVFVKTGEKWKFLGTVDDAGCEVPPSLRQAWSLATC